MMRTFCPASMRPARRPWMAVVADIGTAAACSNVRFDGLRASLSSRAAAYSAKCAAADAEHLVADREPGHLRADRHDRAGDGQTGHAVLRCTEAEAHDAHQVRAAGHRVPRATVEPRRVHSHEHLVGLDLGLVDVGQMPRLARAVGVLRDRSHRIGRPFSGRHVSVVSCCCRDVMGATVGSVR